MLKDQNNWYFFVKSIVTWIIFDQIMNNDINHHNEIMNINILANNF